MEASVSIFQDVRYFICPVSFSERERLIIEYCLLSYGGQHAKTGRSVGELVEFVQQQEISQELHLSLTHVICTPPQYALYEQAHTKFLTWILTPDWVFRSTLRQKMEAEQWFKADPVLFLSSCVVCLPKSQYSDNAYSYLEPLINHYGGKVTSSTTGCTHFVAISNDSDEYHAVCEAQRVGMLYSSKEGDKVSVDDLKRALQKLNQQVLTNHVPQWLLHLLVQQCRIRVPEILRNEWLKDSLIRKRLENASLYRWESCQQRQSSSLESESQEGWDEILTRLQLRVLRIDTTTPEVTLLVESMETIPVDDIYPRLDRDRSVVFEGYEFVLAAHLPRGLAEQLQKLISQNGGKVISTRLDDTTYLVCQYCIGSEYATWEDHGSLNEIVSVQWIHGCISASEIVNRSTCGMKSLEDIIYRPIRHKIPIPEMRTCIFTSTGFNESTSPPRLVLAQAVATLGGCWMTSMNRIYTTHLICNSRNSVKYQRAKHWNANIHCISPLWLFECLKQQRKVPVEPFLIDNEEPQKQAFKPTFQVDEALSAFNPEASFTGAKDSCQGEETKGEVQLFSPYMKPRGTCPGGQLSAKKTACTTPETTLAKASPVPHLNSNSMSAVIASVGAGPTPQILHEALQKAATCAETEVSYQNEETKGEVQLFSPFMDKKTDCATPATAVANSNSIPASNPCSDAQFSAEKVVIASVGAGPTPQTLHKALQETIGCGSPSPIRMVFSQELVSNTKTSPIRDTLTFEAAESPIIESSECQETLPYPCSETLDMNTESMMEDPPCNDDEDENTLEFVSSVLDKTVETKYPEVTLEFSPPCDNTVEEKSNTPVQKLNKQSREIEQDEPPVSRPKLLNPTEETTMTVTEPTLSIAEISSPNKLNKQSREIEQYEPPVSTPKLLNPTEETTMAVTEPTLSIAAAMLDLNVTNAEEMAPTSAEGLPLQSTEHSIPDVEMPKRAVTSKLQTEQMDADTLEAKAAPRKSSRKRKSTVKIVEQLPVKPEEAAITSSRRKTRSKRLKTDVVATDQPTVVKKSSRSKSKSKTEATTPKNATPTETEDTIQPREKLKKTLSRTESVSEKRFLLTGSDAVRNRETRILKLGGTISTTGRQFDPRCTHIICSELKRTEKFVAGCASGKWILYPSYIADSMKAGKFLNEVDYEWGPATAKRQRKKYLFDDRICLTVPSYWRNRINADLQAKPFNGWKFILHPDIVPPPHMCQRIIEAGGGCVIKEKEKDVIALVPSTMEPNHEYVDELSRVGISCLESGFLIDYVTKSQTPAPPVMDDYRITSS